MAAPGNVAFVDGKDLTIGGVSALIGVSTATGKIIITDNKVGGKLTVNEKIDPTDVTLTADQMAINNAIVATNCVTLQPFTDGTLIALGGNDAPGRARLGARRKAREAHGQHLVFW